MDFSHFAAKLDAAGCTTFWFGAANNDEVVRLGELLGVSLPVEFAEFLRQLGGGGVEGAELTGLDGVANEEGAGTVLGETKRLREDFSLPRHLVVVRLDDDEYAWCLDCSGQARGVVVGVELGVDKTPSLVADGFAAFFEEYVESQIEIGRALSENWQRIGRA